MSVPMASQSRFYQNWQGARRNNSRQSLTIRNELNRLKRKVNRNSSEKLVYRVGFTHTPASAGLSQYNFDLTAAFRASGQFANDITGDEWRNLSLSLKTDISTNYSSVRVLVYKPKTPATVIDLTTVVRPFTEFIDPKAHLVYVDKTWNPNTGANPQGFFKAYIPLKALMTKLNSNDTRVESGQLRIAIVTDGAPNPIAVSMMEIVQNK